MSDAHATGTATANSQIGGFAAELERLAATLTGMLSQFQTFSIPIGDDRPILESLKKTSEELATTIQATFDAETAPKEEVAQRTSGARFIEWNTPTPQAETHEPPDPAPDAKAAAQAAPRKHKAHEDPTGGSWNMAPSSAPGISVPATLDPIDDLPEEDCPPMHRCADLLMEDLSRDCPPRTSDGENLEVTLQGTNESLPLRSVFQFIGQSNKTGTLRVKTNEETLIFEIVDGHLVFSSTDKPPRGQRLGEVLVGFGLVTSQELEEFMANHDDSTRLGQAIANEEFVPLSELRRALEYQIRHRLLRAFRATDSAFTFAEGGSPTEDDRVHMNVTDLLSE